MSWSSNTSPRRDFASPGQTRGRGGAGRGRGQSSAYRPNPPALITDRLGAVIQDISLEGVDHFPHADVENVIAVTSYDWLGQDKPTIGVPGSPRLWTNRSPPFSCTPDEGPQFIDQSGYHCPQSPLTPLISAVRTHNPAFDLGQMDIVTDRNGLRKLFGWANNTPKRDEFRIDIQKAGLGTILFTRWEPRNKIQQGSWSRPRYGFSFEHATTKTARGVLPTAGHHRIVAYDFGELRLLVRFEVDACLPTEVAPTLDDLISQTASLAISSSRPPEKSQPDTVNGLKILRSGDSLVPQNNIIELTSRVSCGSIDWDNIFPQLYLSGTPRLIIGYHDAGNFHQIEHFNTEDVDDETMREAKRKTQDGLNRLALVLGLVRDAVLDLTDDDASGDRSERLLSLVCQEKKLKLYERTGGSKLPEELVAHFRD